MTLQKWKMARKLGFKKSIGYAISHTSSNVFGNWHGLSGLNGHHFLLQTPTYMATKKLNQSSLALKAVVFKNHAFYDHPCSRSRRKRVENCCPRARGLGLEGACRKRARALFFQIGADVTKLGLERASHLRALDLFFKKRVKTRDFERASIIFRRLFDLKHEKSLKLRKSSKPSRFTVNRENGHL